jgi:hypothetical protein
MAKTISEPKYKNATAFVVKHVEPRIGKLIEEVNKTFAAQGIRCGVEVKWFFDEIDADDKAGE